MDSGKGLECKQDKTDQSFRKSCDINALMARYKKTGVPPTAAGGISFVDLTGLAASDLQTKLNEALRLSESVMKSFNDLPLDTRKFFDYNPEKMLAFLSESKNDEISRSLGLIKDKPKEPPEPPATGATG